MNTDKYTVGSQLESWNGSTAQSLTFIVTEDCNLRCKYCFADTGEFHGGRSRMSAEVGKKARECVINYSGIRKNMGMGK